jgi:hypothetical protein
MMARRSVPRRNSCVDKPHAVQESPDWGAGRKTREKGDGSADHGQLIEGIEGSEKIFYSEAIHGRHNCLPVKQEPTIGFEPTTY